MVLSWSILFDLTSMHMDWCLTTPRLASQPQLALCVLECFAGGQQTAGLLLKIIDALQCLPYYWPFSGGQARNAEAMAYLTKSMHTYYPAVGYGGRATGAPRESRAGLECLTRGWWLDSLCVVESRTRANLCECWEANFNPPGGRTFYPFRAVQKEKILS